MSVVCIIIPVYTIAFRKFQGIKISDKDTIIFSFTFIFGFAKSGGGCGIRASVLMSGGTFFTSPIPSVREFRASFYTLLNFTLPNRGLIVIGKRS